MGPLRTALLLATYRGQGRGLGLAMGLALAACGADPGAVGRTTGETDGAAEATGGSGGPGETAGGESATAGSGASSSGDGEGSGGSAGSSDGSGGSSGGSGASSGSSGSSGSEGGSTTGDPAPDLGGVVMCDAPVPPDVGAGAASVAVPGDGTLAEAIVAVTDGGVIELAAGTYAAPAGGWVINQDKSFTVRAAAGQKVVLDGGGTEIIINYLGGATPDDKTIRFEGLTFQNGYAVGSRGAVFLNSAVATFVDCTFEDNVHGEPSTGGGGALRIAGQSDVVVEHCTFRNNTARSTGGAILLAGASTMRLEDSVLTGNGTSVDGHDEGSSGGAIYVFNAELDVVRTHFEANVAGYSGGAIYAHGAWQAPFDVARSVVDIADSTFVGNIARPHACCASNLRPVGGALLAENQVDMTVLRSQFVENVALWGGAIGTYRGDVVVEDSLFRGNRGDPQDTRASVGGTFNVVSVDMAFNPENYPPTHLTLRRSLVQGRYGATGAAAHQGGCLYAAGDRNRMYGDNGVTQMGTFADNAAGVLIEGSVFYECDVEGDAMNASSGGAMAVTLTDLTVTDSMFLGSDATGNGGTGGVLRAFPDTHFTAHDSVFAFGSADTSGGVVQFSGGEIELQRNLLVGNELSPGVDEAAAMSPGSVLLFSDLATTGVVAENTFASNVGLVIVERESMGGEANSVVYNDNDFFEPAFGGDVFRTVTAGPGETLGVAELNDLTVQHGAGGSTKKSATPNRVLGAAPTLARLVAAPSSPGGAACCAIEDLDAKPAVLGYAWLGSSAQLADTDLTTAYGIADATRAGSHRLVVDDSEMAEATVAAATCP